MVYFQGITVEPSDTGVAMASTDFLLTRKVNGLIKPMEVVSE